LRRLYDLTHPLGPATPVFPGDDPVRLSSLAAIHSDGYEATRLELGTHSGTHVDAPAHLIPDGARLPDLPLELWIGPALLLEASDLSQTSLHGVRRLLLAGCPDGIPVAWAQRIAAEGVRLLGVDGPSLDPVNANTLPAHRALLATGMVLLENLRLEGAPRGAGMLYCLPLSVDSGDGAPARVLWEPEGESGALP
jgi:arylformamidase